MTFDRYYKAECRWGNTIIPSVVSVQKTVLTVSIFVLKPKRMAQFRYDGLA